MMVAMFTVLNTCSAYYLFLRVSNTVTNDDCAFELFQRTAQAVLMCSAWAVSGSTNMMLLLCLVIRAQNVHNTTLSV